MIAPVGSHVFLNAVVEAVLHFVHVGLVLPCVPPQESPPVLRQELLRHGVLTSARIDPADRANDAIIHFEYSILL